MQRYCTVSEPTYNDLYLDKANPSPQTLAPLLTEMYLTHLNSAIPTLQP